MSDSGRDWRKVYRSITSSERLASVSDAAAWLYVLLLVSQDDEGRYPWTRAMVRTLTATRPDWSFADTSALLHELVDVELVSLEDDLAVLRRGSELNGVPRSAHEQRQYESAALLRQGVTDAAAEGSSPDGGSPMVSPQTPVPFPSPFPPPPRTPSARTRGITPKFIERMVQEYAERLGGEAEVRQRIESAMNHTASKKWIDKQRGVQGWLRRDAQRLLDDSRRNGGPSKHAAGAQASDERFAEETADG